MGIFEVSEGVEIDSVIAGILQVDPEVAIVFYSIVRNIVIVTEFQKTKAVNAVSSDDITPEGISCSGEESDSIEASIHVITYDKIII